MKYLKELTATEQITLREAGKEGPATARVCLRAHALYLSGPGYRIPQLVPNFSASQ